MASPSVTAMAVLKRLGRYLLQAERVDIRFDGQGDESEIVVSCDSDWAVSTKP